MNSRSKPVKSDSDADAKKAASIRWALASLSLTMLLSSLGTSIANVGLPILAEAFQASFQQVQWIVIAYLLAITTLIVGVGHLGDLMGRRRLMLAGIFIFTSASVLCGIAPSLSLLIAARAMQGLGAAVMMALTMALVSEIVPKEKAGSAMGLLGTMSAIGTALGPTLGGLLIAYFGWQSLFLVNLPLGLLALLLACFHLPANRKSPAADLHNFDFAGMLLLTLTLSAYALAMTMRQHGSDNDFGLLNVALILMAIAGLCLFIFAEKKTEAPLIRLLLFRNSQLSAGFAMSAIVTTVVMATLVVGPFYLSGALALDTAAIGFVMSSGPIVAALTGVPAGRIVDRFGAQKMSIGGLVAMAAGSFFFSMMTAGFGIAGYIAPLVVITAGYALFQTSNNTAVMANITADHRGVVSGMLNLSRNLGLITGTSVMGAVFALASKSNDIATASPDAIARGMQMTFTVATILLLFALAIALATVGRKSRWIPIEKVPLDAHQTHQD